MIPPLIPLPCQLQVIEGNPVAAHRIAVVGPLPDAAAAAAAWLRHCAGAAKHSAGVGQRSVVSETVVPGRPGAPTPVQFVLVTDQSAHEAGAPGGYRLQVRETGEPQVVVEASGAAGFFAAVASLLQLWEAGGGTLPQVDIVDSPRFQWRGLSFDIARSFFRPAVLTRLVDLLADLKLNVLHLHLTDDQGWRIEIPSRPDLARVSGATAVAGGEAGFLSADEFTALVAHATSRGVRVIPEFDLPGHTNAALHACPQLNPSGRAPEAYAGDEVGFSQLYLTVPETAAFLRDVVGDLAAMSPDPYLHIGGDEAEAMDRAEYAALVTMAAEFVRHAGKRPIAWQEGAGARLGADLALQYWNTGPQDAEPSNPYAQVALRSRRETLEQVRAGAKVVLSPAARTYFDMRYQPGWPMGQDWAGCISLREAYAWDPAAELEGLGDADILGVEAGIWTEFLHSEQEIYTMLLPRLAAFAEVAWTAQSARRVGDFEARLRQHPQWWSAAKAAGAPLPW